MNDRIMRPALAVALGVICAAVGAVLLVAALDVRRPSIAWALPLTLVATGVAMLITAGPRPGGGNRRRDAR